MEFAAMNDDLLSDELLIKDGPGACGKCHVSETDEVRVEWKAASEIVASHHKYSHVPHLNVLGPGLSVKHFTNLTHRPIINRHTTTAIK